MPRDSTVGLTSDRLGWADRIYDVGSVRPLRCTEIAYSRKCSTSTSYNVQYCLIISVLTDFEWFLLPLTAQVEDALSGFVRFKVRMIIVTQWMLYPRLDSKLRVCVMYGALEWHRSPKIRCTIDCPTVPAQTLSAGPISCCGLPFILLEHQLSMNSSSGLGNHSYLGQTPDKCVYHEAARSIATSRQQWAIPSCSGRHTIWCKKR